MLALGGLLLFGAWLAWFGWSRVGVYEVSEQARIELESTSRALMVAKPGQVVRVDLTLGKLVHAGDVLVELDSKAQELELREAEVRASGILSQMEQARAELERELAARSEELTTNHLSVQEARARAREARIESEAAAREFARLTELSQKGVVPVRDFERSESDAAAKRTAWERSMVVVEQVSHQQRLRDREREVRLERLRGQLTREGAEHTTLLAQIERLRHEVERRKVRAPVAGRLAEVSQTHVGDFITEGQRLASIVPDGRPVVVARFLPRAALGRIQPGQRAELRLAGFPWAEYGTLPVTVTRVAGEVRDGSVRVEAELVANTSFRGPVQHGVPGVLEVEIERISPCDLTLRSAGQWLTRGP